MGYKDTLTLYEELTASGIEDKQAKIQAHQLGGLSDHLGLSIDKMNAKLDKIDKDLFWMRLIGGAMFIAFASAWFK